MENVLVTNLKKKLNNMGEYTHIANCLGLNHTNLLNYSLKVVKRSYDHRLVLEARVFTTGPIPTEKERINFDYNFEGYETDVENNSAIYEWKNSYYFRTPKHLRRFLDKWEELSSEANQAYRKGCWDVINELFEDEDDNEEDSWGFQVRGDYEPDYEEEDEFENGYDFDDEDWDDDDDEYDEDC